MTAKLSRSRVRLCKSGARARVLIPKSAGGMRQLEIPAVLDRFVQQLILQVLQPFSIRLSQNTATVSGRDAGLTMKCARRSSTSSPGDGGWWTWIWRNSLTA